MQWQLLWQFVSVVAFASDQQDLIVLLVPFIKLDLAL